MEYNKYIADFAIGDEVEGFYILKTAASKVSGSGKPFLAAVLADSSGSIEAKVWDYSGPIGPSHEGSVIKARGSVSEFRGSLQFIVSRIRPVQSGDQYSLDNLVPCAPIDVDGWSDELQDFVGSLEDPDYRALCQKLLDQYGQRFRDIPGGKSMHHSFLHGLLMHTVNMARIADDLAGLYEDVIDRDLLMAGTLLHDIAKCEEFVTSSLGLVTA